MDIAAVSMANSQSKVQTALNIGLMKDTMETAEANATKMIDEMLPAAPAQFGFDTYA